MSAVFDADAIRARRAEIFGRPPEPHPMGARLNGTGMVHCNICPLARAAYCSLTCSAERQKLEKIDGVKVY